MFSQGIVTTVPSSHFLMYYLLLLSHIHISIFNRNRKPCICTMYYRKKKAKQNSNPMYKMHIFFYSYAIPVIEAIKTLKNSLTN